jgi:hypothetical protein
MKVEDIGIEKSVELPLMEDQEMIQAFSPHASQKAFTHGIRLRRSVRRAKDFDAARGCYSGEMRAEFTVVIPDQIFWRVSIGGRFSQLLCHPRIAGSTRHIDMDNLSRSQLDDEERKKWAEEEVRNLEEIASPDLCRMVAQERFPGLSTQPFAADGSHIFLDGSFTHPNIELEQLTPDALRSPEPIACGHLLDQADRLGRELRLSLMHLRFVLPEQAEKLTRPSEERLWLDQEERLFPGSDHPGKEHQKEPIRLPIDWSLDLSMQNEQLLS